MKILFFVSMLFCAFSLTAQSDLPVLSVLNFESVSVSEGETKLFTDLISSYFVMLNKYRVIDSNQRQNILKEFKFALSGCTDEECQLEIGKLLSAEFIVVGSLGMFGERFVLTIKIIEVESGQTLNSASKIYTDMNSLIDGAFILVSDLTGTVSDDLPDTAYPDSGNIKQDIIYVSSVAKLLESIKSNTTIILEPGSYRLNINQDLTNNSKIKWLDNYDGYYPAIQNVSNLKIKGSKSGKTEILIEPLYGWVLEFVDCENIILEDLIMGHTEQGSCLGGVLNLIDCDDITVKNCDLFGSGTIGIAAETTSNLIVEDSIIRECSYGLLEFRNSENISFVNTPFLDTKGFALIFIINSYDIEFTNCEFTDNAGSELFQTDDLSESIFITNCSFTRNITPLLYNSSTDITFSECTYKGNSFRNNP